MIGGRAGGRGLDNDMLTRGNKWWLEQERRPSIATLCSCETGPG
jgi:hypothetical protein